MPDRTVGDLAILLHSHMPYVEGFGTYPFGEEWLFDAVARSHLPVLEVARGVTVTVTPVLADQLEAPGVSERMRAFLSEYRLGAAERDVRSEAPDLRPAAEREAELYRRAVERLDRERSALEAFASAQREGRVELVASAADGAELHAPAWIDDGWLYYARTRNCAPAPTCHDEIWRTEPRAPSTGVQVQSPSLLGLRDLEVDPQSACEGPPVSHSMTKRTSRPWRAPASERPRATTSLSSTTVRRSTRRATAIRRSSFARPRMLYVSRTSGATP